MTSGIVCDDQGKYCKFKTSNSEQTAVCCHPQSWIEKHQNTIGLDAIRSKAVAKTICPKALIIRMSNADIFHIMETYTLISKDFMWYMPLVRS